MQENARLEHPPSLSRTKVRSLAEIVAVFAIGTLLVATGLSFAGENPLSRQGVIWVAYVVMLAAVGIGLRLRGDSWSSLGLGRFDLRWRSAWRYLWQSIVLLAAVLVAYVAAAILMANITGIPEQADVSKYNFLSGNLPLLLLSLVGVWIVSSLGEEILYRGFLVTRLANLRGGGKSAWKLAVVASSILFGLIHYEWGPMGMVQTGFMGLALGTAFLLLKRNLWVLILTHFYMDTILLVQMYFAPAS
jgi:membrane protease YdiL (CAAX protease family)